MRLGALALILPLWMPVAAADEGKVVSYAVGGKYFDDSDVPIYRVAPDGTVDWYTAKGREAYQATCNACHGPRGSGSPYGSSLTQAIDTTRYFDFIDTIVNGQILESGGAVRVMPSFGTTPQVVCNMDAIYIYLRAEAANVLNGDLSPERVEPNTTAEAELADCLR